jgi:hypothetical protein
MKNLMDRNFGGEVDASVDVGGMAVLRLLVGRVLAFHE